MKGSWKRVSWHGLPWTIDKMGKHCIEDRLEEKISYRGDFVRNAQVSCGFTVKACAFDEWNRLRRLEVNRFSSESQGLTGLFFVLAVFFLRSNAIISTVVQGQNRPLANDLRY